jgi:hypothetical protein
MTFKDFPPWQKATSLSVDELMERMERSEAQGDFIRRLPQWGFQTLAVRPQISSGPECLGFPRPCSGKCRSRSRAS